MKFNIIIFCVCISVFTKAQTPQKAVSKIELDAAYFGELGFNPGVKVALNRYFRQKEKHNSKRPITWSLNTGLSLNLTYFSLPDYTHNVMLGPKMKTNITRSKLKKNGSIFHAFVEMGMGVNLFQSYLKGGVYQPNADGTFDYQQVRANTGIATVVSFTFGTSIPKIPKPTQWFIGVDAGSEFSSNKYSFPFIGATVGVRTQFEKQNKISK